MFTSWNSHPEFLVNYYGLHYMQEKADDPNASHVVHGEVVPHYTVAKITKHVIKWCIRDLSSAWVDPGFLESGFIYI